ncbi:DinB family protein [Kordia zhangzhouensis]|uniref:DinB family protein n=1 Tax=Kordia zhangzhouensis TaxID=1620405 RepID=UPI000628FD7F|nr:DinB family protein [Kordia zhangzhouensis]
MKKYVLVLTLLVSLLANAQDTPITAFLEKWENSKNYLVEMAELMPEDAYDYKPTERQKTFREQLIHIKQNMDWLSTTYFSVEKKKTKEGTLTTKADIIAALKASFTQTSTMVKTAKESDLKEIVEFFAGPKTKLQILNLLQDHVTHHRGQLIVYLNLNNIEPPRYRGW